MQVLKAIIKGGEERAFGALISSFCQS